jgi:CDP-diacylglycerol--serine O-phosphatidyltransferase
MMMSHVGEGCAPEWLAFIAFVIPVFGELRLARFNIDTRQTTSFRGMPIPANAIFWIGTVALTEEICYIGAWPMALLIVAVASLMVADGFKMFSLKFKNFRPAENWPRFVLVGGAVVLVALLGVPGLAATILLYVAMSAIVGDLAGH